MSKKCAVNSADEVIEESILEEVEQKEAFQEALVIIESLISPTPCSYDSDHFCFEHSKQRKRPCPHNEAKRFLMKNRR